MLIKVSILVIGVFIGAVYSAAIDCNIDECRKPIKVYEELRCKPIYGSKSCCPKRFECSENSLVEKIDANKCEFEDKTYEIGEVMRRSNDSKCLETCVCSRPNNESAKFLCSKTECNDDDHVNGCVKIYSSIHECCSTSIVCDEAEKEQLATCWDGSHSYREGEKFISKSNPCYECMCHKDFDNTTITQNSHQHCRKLNCDIELKYKSFIRRGCLPIFENDKCCPIDWICPPNEFNKKKLVVKRGIRVSDIHYDSSSEEDDDDNDSHSDESNSEEIIETTTLDQTTLESIITTTTSQKLFTINIDPFIAPKESSSLDEKEDEEISTEEQTKSLIEPELEKYAQTTPLAVVENLEITTVTEESLKIDDNTEKQVETQEEKEEETTVENLTENSIETTTSPIEEENEENEEEEIDIDKIIAPRIFLEAPKVEIDFEVHIASPKEEENAKQSNNKEGEEIDQSKEEVTESPKEEDEEEITTTDSSIIENETTTEELEITTEIIEKIPSSTLPTIANTTTKAPKLIIKPSVHFIPPPPAPSPTAFEILTTLKEYVAKLESKLVADATKTSKIDQSEATVNYTISRSLNDSNEKEEEEEKTISKRSASSYFKHANKEKEKGCTYGKRHYKIGEKIRTDNKCLDCFCLYSPIGHCVKKTKCET